MAEQGETTCLYLYRPMYVNVNVFSGIVMAVTAGLLFGFNFTPVIYIQQHPKQFPTASNNGKWTRLTFVDINYCQLFSANCQATYLSQND